MSLRAFQLLLGVIICGFVISAGYVSTLVVKRQYSLEYVSRYRPSWDASQASNEFVRLEQRLAEYGDPGSDVDENEIRLRFDILTDRAKSFIRSDILTEPLRGYPEYVAALRQLSDILRSIEPLIDNIDQPGAAQKALQALKPLEAIFIQIASVAHSYSANTVAAEQEGLLSMHWRFTGIVAGLILSGFILLALLLRHIGLLSGAHKKLRVLAHRDSLTGLANRALFQETLEGILANRESNKATHAVLLLDLDRFKDVNDSFGHGMGDALLKEVTARIGNCVAEGDVIARLGGDEFAVLQMGITNLDGCARLATQIVTALGAPYFIDGHEIVIGASIGIALLREGRTPSQILQFADLALYRAKAVGRGTYQFFAPEMDEQLQARRRLELDLRKAISNDELMLAYQPIVNLEAYEICGFEALLRWNHPEKGLIAPGDFIPLAEETGLIASLGRWVLQHACTEAAKWPDHIRVAVNLSPVQFRSGNLAQQVIAALDASGLSPSRLELEITESVLLQDNDATLTTLHQLRSMGIRIALDDFGTGYSSLSYLRRFPFDKIKVDQLFVRDLPDEGDAAVIVESIVRLGASLRMITTAEGVETEEQLVRLRAAGCTQAQGFFFAKPKPAQELSYSLKRCPALERAA